MSKQEILKWMDKQIKIVKVLNEIQQLGDEIMACGVGSKEEVHIFKGIDKITDATGIRLEYVYCEDCEKYKHEYHFSYKGIKFFQLEEEPIYDMDR